MKEYYQWKSKIVERFDTLFPDPPYISYLNMEPSWLRDPRGSRIKIDIFYPEFPLAVLLHKPSEVILEDKIILMSPPETEWIVMETIKRELEKKNIPLLAIRYGIEGTVDTMVRLLRSSIVDHPFEERIEEILSNVGY